jgi:NADH dehydrogenase
MRRRDGPPDGQGQRRRVVVVGGGFAGLRAARTLRGKPVDVTVIDHVNHHLFQPLLYQVATAVLNAGDIAVALRQALRGPNVTVLLAEVQSIDLASKLVVHDGGQLAFDDLILATGATHSYFNHPEWARHAPGLKTLEDAFEVRRRVLLAFEMAERCPDRVTREGWLTFVIVGGGPTGVELAGALAEMSRHSLRGDFRRIDPRRARILLLEGLPRLLTAWPEPLSRDARLALERRGVEVRTGQFVSHVDDEGVEVVGERIAARTVLWGAGVRASPLARTLGVPLDRAGRVQVTPFLTIPGRDDVFVAGDVAALAIDGVPVPGLAPAALQEGEHTARNILRKQRGQPMRPFRYNDRGQFAVVGRGAAVGVAFRRVRMKGVLAWLVWLGVHVLYLAGFRNRIAVLLGWGYAFFTRRRPMRLIYELEPKLVDDRPVVTGASAAVQRRPAET